MRLIELPWPEVSSELDQGTPVILPFGSIEQHGPHLPLETDTICVEAVADRAAATSGAIALPALSYGAPSRPRSGGGPNFPIGADIPLGVYHEVARGIIENLLRHQVRNLMLLTWHTENAAVIYDAARAAASAAQADGVHIVCLDEPGNLITPETAEKAFVDGFVDPSFEHAGLIETSVMLALDETAVKPFADIDSQLPSLPYDVIPQPDGVVAPSGSFTSPKNATAEIGTLLLDELVPATAAIVENEFASRRSAGKAG